MKTRPDLPNETRVVVNSPVGPVLNGSIIEPVNKRILFSSRFFLVRIILSRHKCRFLCGIWTVTA